MMSFKSISRKVSILAVAAFILTNCEDPDEFLEPINPDLVTEAVVGTVQSGERTLAGAERQLSLTMNELVPPAEIVTDNYQNTRTFFNQFLDDLDIDFTDQDVRELEFAIARLRELTTTGIDVIYPADESATDDILAGMYFLRGMSYLIGGEAFKTLPAEPGGAPQPSSAHFELAVENFTTAIATNADSQYGQAALIARARAYYNLGNRQEASADAAAATESTPGFLYSANYDPNNDSGADDNLMQDALYDRGTFDDLQPLPALDFLDPKYNGSDATFDYSIPVVKVEEAHLILAEAALSQGDLEGAKSRMKTLAAFVATRPTATFDDRREGRTDLAPSSRPDSTVIEVAPGPNREFEEGLVLSRQVPTVTVPTVSGVSLTEEEIEAIGNLDFAYEELYRMRQQIFIAEGRRMADLGIKFPVSQRESDANPSVTSDDNQPQIPSFLLGINFDAFTYNPALFQVTVTNNLNRIISENRSSPLIAPFE